MGEGGAFFEGLRRRMAVENLDPGDRLLELLTPGMIVEHIQRYRFASGLFPGGIAIISIPYRYSGSIGGNVYHRYEPTRDELKLMISDAGLKIEKEMGQVVCSEAQAAKFRSRLNKPLNSKTFQYWLEGQNGKEAVANFFNTLTHIFVVKK